MYLGCSRSAVLVIRFARWQRQKPIHIMMDYSDMQIIEEEHSITVRTNEKGLTITSISINKVADMLWNIVRHNLALALKPTVTVGYWIQLFLCDFHGFTQFHANSRISFSWLPGALLGVLITPRMRRESQNVVFVLWIQLILQIFPDFVTMERLFTKFISRCDCLI